MIALHFGMVALWALLPTFVSPHLHLHTIYFSIELYLHGDPVISLRSGIGRKSDIGSPERAPWHNGGN